MRARLIIYCCRVFLEQVVATSASCVLQAIYGFRIKQVVFALTAPLILTTEFKFAMDAKVWPTWMSNCMTCGDFSTYLL